MKWVPTALAALVIAVVLGHYLASDPGTVVISYGGKIARTSLVVFLALVGAGGIALYTCARFARAIVQLPWRWNRWVSEYRQRRSNHALGAGTVALAERDFARAERLLSRGAATGPAAVARYLGAAEAAQRLNAPARRDHYLELARSALPAADIAVTIERARMQIEDRRFDEAQVLLAELRARHPRNPRVLALLCEVLAQSRDWHALRALLPALRRLKACEKSRLMELEIATAAALLANPGTSPAELDALWEQLPKTCREEPAVLAAYAGRLIELQRGDEAEARLQKALPRCWDPRLVSLYGIARATNPARQLERAESWQSAHADDPDLLLVLAQLSLELQLWGKARAYLDRLAVVRPSPLACRMQSEIAERTGDREAAARFQRAGLALATAAGTGERRLISRQAAGAVQPAQQR